MKFTLLLVMLATLLITIHGSPLKRKCECRAVSNTVHFPFHSWDISSCYFCSCKDAAMTNCEAACRSQVEQYARSGCGKGVKGSKVKYSWEASSCSSGISSNEYIKKLASARHLCQHTDFDGTTCTSNDYVLCPHCQLQLCLKHLNSHQDSLRIDCDRLTDQVNSLRANLDHLSFDSKNYRDILSQRLDQWYQERIEFIQRIYREKQEQLKIFYLQAETEFDMYRMKKEQLFHNHVSKKWKKILQHKQIHVEDLNEMKIKLDQIERGLDELKHLLIDISIDPITRDIQIFKRRYVEAAKASFNDDDDNHLWTIDDDDDDDEIENQCENEMFIDKSNHQNITSSSQSNLHSPKETSSQLQQNLPTSSDIQLRKSPLKLVIKRLQPTNRSTKVKYQFQAIPPPLST